MGDLMRVPPGESGLARVGKQVAAGALVLVIVIFAASAIIHFLVGALIAAAAVAAIIGVLYWAFFKR